AVTDTHGDRLLFQETYVSDSVGNRQSSEAILPLPPLITAHNDTAHFNDDNQFKDRNGTAAYLYDDDGNLTAYPGFTGQARYDVFNQMTQYGSDVYTYDPDGFRTRIEVSGLTTHFVYDVGGYHNPMREYADPRRQTIGAALTPGPAGDQVGLAVYGGRNLDPVVADNGSLDRVLEERDASGKVQARYVHGLGLISREAEDGSGYRVFHYDSRGSTIALTDSHGSITDRYAYNPFGALVNRAGQTPNHFCYNGRDGVYFDDNGLFYMRSRYFHAGLVRFLQQDILYGSATQPQSFNRYAYVVGNPVSSIDPPGLGATSDSGGQPSSQSPGSSSSNRTAIIIGSISAGGILILGAAGAGAAVLLPEFAGFLGISWEAWSGLRGLEAVESSGTYFNLEEIGSTEISEEARVLNQATNRLRNRWVKGRNAKSVWQLFKPGTD